jgi:hypothetical protein
VGDVGQPHPADRLALAGLAAIWPPRSMPVRHTPSSDGQCRSLTPARENDASLPLEMILACGKTNFPCGKTIFSCGKMIFSCGKMNFS